MIEPSKSRRSVKANGAKLKSLRLAAGVTQEELAEQIGYSDRLIRKAEMSGRIDLKSIRALFQYYAAIGQAVELSELILAESENRADLLPERWFDLLFQQRDFAAAASLLASDCLVCMDGISVDPDRVENVVSWLTSVFDGTKFAIDYRATRGAWHVIGWTSIRSATDFELNDTRRQHGKHPASDGKQAGDDGNCNASAVDASKWGTFTVCGTTSFRVKEQHIIEIREFSDTALYFPDYYLWLQQQARGSVPPIVHREK